MRTSHATPELCPSSAASADIARRRLLTAVAAAPVIAAALPAAAERRSDDDAPLFAMSRRIAELNAEGKRLGDQADALHALYDKNKTDYVEARVALGIDKIEDMQGKVWDKIHKIIDDITIYQPKTIAGVVEKMRIFKNEREEIFSIPPEELDFRDRLFLSALADFERLALRA